VIKDGGVAKRKVAGFLPGSITEPASFCAVSKSSERAKHAKQVPYCYDDDDGRFLACEDCGKVRV
jgi:hypothetical protein